ncbi:MAG: prepilin peptidase [Nitrospinota bacterium]
MSQQIILILYFFVIGACVGSFLNVVIHRLPKGESLVRPGSRCPACKTPIKAYHNIPIMSYIFLRGRCASCGGKFSARYPLVELTTGLVIAACYVKFGFTATALLYMAFASSLVAIAFIDIDHMIIPDVITLPGIVIGLLAAAFVLPVGIKFSFLGLLVGGGLFLLLAIIVPGGMGGGDIKLMGMVGAFLGLKAVLITIFAGSLVGSIVGVIGIVACGKGRKTKIPFGPYLVLGALMALFYESELIDFYLRTFVY